MDSLLPKDFVLKRVQRIKNQNVSIAVLSSETSDDDHIKNVFPQKTVKGLSITMLVAGVMSIIVQISLNALHFNDRIHWAIEFGIWSGAFTLLTGGVGLLAAKRPTSFSTYRLMACSIFSAGMVITNVSLEWQGAVDAASRHVSAIDGCLYSFLYIIGITEAITSIILSFYTFRTICLTLTRPSNPARKAAAINADAIVPSAVTLTKSFSLIFFKLGIITQSYRTDMHMGFMQQICENDFEKKIQPPDDMDLSKDTTASTAPESQELLAPSYNALAKKMYGDHFKKFFPKKAVMGMSIAMIIAGALSAILQIVLIFLSDMYDMPNFFRTPANIGQGIWCGVFFIITGGLGMAAANNPSDCSIITLMVFSIISAVMGVPHMVLDGFGADKVQSYPSGWVTSRYQSYQVEAVWLYSVLFILGLAVAIISIVLSSYTCRAICCRRSNAGSVIHNPSGVAATVQTIPMGNLDLSKVVLSKDTTASTAPEPQELLTPSYNALAKMMYEPPNVVQTKPESRSLSGTRVF